MAIYNSNELFWGVKCRYSLKQDLNSRVDLRVLDIKTVSFWDNVVLPR